MKPQDIVFLLLLVGLLYKRNPKWLVTFGLVTIVLSIPLFYLQIFFTAQRFVIYAAVFLLVAIFFHILQLRKHDRIKK